MAHGMVCVCVGVKGVKGVKGGSEGIWDSCISIEFLSSIVLLTHSLMHSLAYSLTLPVVMLAVVAVVEVMGSVLAIMTK
jgi:hypothetical protein